MYIKILDTETKSYRLLETLDRVQNYLISVENVSLSTSSNLSLSLLEKFDIYKVKCVPSSLIEDKYKRYYAIEYDNLTYSNDGYSIDEIYTLDITLVNAHWDELREQRNKALFNTDWIISSNDITNSCKDKYIAYRNLLRIIDVVEYPVDYIFPDQPPIEILNTNYSLTEENIERLKTFRAIKDPELYESFLSKWSKYNYINRSDIVSSLLTITTGRKLGDIL